MREDSPEKQKGLGRFFLQVSVCDRQKEGLDSVSLGFQNTKPIERETMNDDRGSQAASAGARVCATGLSGLGLAPGSSLPHSRLADVPKLPRFQLPANQPQPARHVHTAGTWGGGS